MKNTPTTRVEQPAVGARGDAVMKTFLFWIVILSLPLPLHAAEPAGSGAGGSPIAPDEWPQFRGPRGDGRSAAVDLPLTWSETENIVWKKAVPGRGWSSPVVVGEYVWLTTALETAATDEEETQRLAGNKYQDTLAVVAAVSLRVLGFHRETGELLHNVELFRIEKPDAIHKLNTYATPTPVAEPGRVYCDFGTFGTACLDSSTGKIIWTCRLPVDHQVGPVSSPILCDDLLVLARDGCDAQYVAALNKQTGETVWKTDRPPIDLNDEFKKAFCSPLLLEADGHCQIVVPGASWVVSYELRTGKPLWQVDYGKAYSNVPTPVFGHGLAYVCTNTPGFQLWAIRVDGRGDVTDTHVAWKTTKQVPKKASPLLAGDEIYTVSDIGVATCLDGRTGANLWTQRIAGNYSASPVYADGRIYFFSEEGKTVVYRSDRTPERLAENHVQGRVVASPAVVGRAIFLRTDTHMYRIERPQTARSCHVTRLAAPLAIDAKWDKTAWKNIRPERIGNYMGDKPEHLPKTDVKIAYDDAALYVIFRVEDQYVRAVTAEHQKGEVWKDSCVEFFFYPNPEIPGDQHFYIEMNCGGTMLFRFNGPEGVVEIPKNHYDQMTIAHSLPKMVDPEMKGPVTWTVEYRLPFEIVKKHCPTMVPPASGTKWRANFYKCADDSSHPHWLTWSPVDFPKPKFHLPDFFGVLKLE
jgi:outer membrane protein assembly factor BamB